jgi:hypothetical protein
MSDYGTTRTGKLERHEVTHKNGERTAVLVHPVFDGWLVVAVDLPASGFEALAETVVAVCATRSEAKKRAEAWCEEHPKGVNPGGFGGLKEMMSG